MYVPGPCTFVLVVIAIRNAISSTNFACAGNTLLTQRPPLFLLDEPLAHLDLNHQIAVLDLFAGAARDCGAAVAMVLHDPSLAHRYCDRALFIHGDGRTELGPAEALLTAAGLSRLYGHPLKVLDDGSRRWFVPD